MKKLATLMALVAVAALLLTAAPQQAQARPQYAKALSTKYEKTADAVKEMKCNACHGEEEGKSNKKLLSDYATALKKALEETSEKKKNVKDEKELDAAFELAGKEKGPDGKTFAEILGEGKLPAAHESIKE